MLLSGGLDSATCLAIARERGHECHALSFRYGQRHAIELDAASEVASKARVEHLIVDVDLHAFGGSALTSRAEVPKHDTTAGIGTSGIPPTYVPARNTVLLSLALAFAEVRGAFDIFIGVNALDYSGYPDCRPEYIQAFENMANLATRAAVEGSEPIRIRTPLIALTKAQIIQLGADLGVDFSLTVSCYDPSATGVACGRCDSCLLRRKGFTEAGLTDPIPYPQPGPGGLL